VLLSTPGVPYVGFISALRRHWSANHNGFGDKVDKDIFEKILAGKTGDSAQLWMELRNFAARDFTVENVLFIEELDSLQKESAKLIINRGKSVAREQRVADDSMMSDPSRKHPARRWAPVWRQYLHHSNKNFVPSEMVDRWKEIFDTYISSGAVDQLNISFLVAENARSQIYSGQPFEIDVFDSCRDESLE
ncbi:hypothetical protein HDU93_006870, partial [Gonapodya sp. JEL0774]